MIRDKKLYYTCMAGFIAVLCGSVALLSWYENSKVVEEKVELSNNTMMAIVFADSDGVGVSEVSAEVDLNETLMIELETSAKEALDKSTQLCIEERIEKIFFRFSSKHTTTKNFYPTRIISSIHNTILLYLNIFYLYK